MEQLLKELIRETKMNQNFLKSLLEEVKKLTEVKHGDIRKS